MSTFYLNQLVAIIAGIILCLLAHLATKKKGVAYLLKLNLKHLDEKTKRNEGRIISYGNNYLPKLS